jgi:hypothetical protein
MISGWIPRDTDGLERVGDSLVESRDASHLCFAGPVPTWT